MIALALLVGCGKGDDKRPAPAAASGSAPAKDTTPAQLAGCSPALPRPVDPREPAAPTLPGTPQPPRTGSNPPRVTLAEPSVTGDLDKAIIRRYLRRSEARFQYCFEKVLVRRPTLTGGTMETSFAIQSTGAVASAGADGVDPDVAKCIVDALRMIEFPKPADGNQVQVTVSLTFAAPSGVAVPHRPARTAREWTPFATTDIVASPEVAKPVAEAVTAAVRERMAEVERCLDGARGAVRAILAIDSRGAVTAVRSGGIGDSAIDACIASRLGELTVPAPAEDVEVACDITRGGDAPFRVAPDAGYTIVELTSSEIRNPSRVRDIPPRGATHDMTSLGTASAVLVIAEPDAPSTGIDAALWWAPAGTTLVAVKAAGGAPVFVGMGDSRADRQPFTTKRVAQLRVEASHLRACVGTIPLGESARIVDPHAVDRVLAAVVAECAKTPCESTIVVGTSSEYIAKELVAATSAARRAGFTSISIGGPACD